jgi:hypothetical protein
MVAKLTADQQRELDATPGGAIRIEHPSTHAVYVLVDELTHERAMRALREQEDRAAVAEGIAQMEASEGRPLADVDAEMRKDFEFLRGK